MQEALPKHLALKRFSYISTQQICCSYSFCVSIINTQLQNEKGGGKMGHARNQALIWGWKVKSVGACMVLCVCVCSCFRNIWTPIKVTKKVLKSRWDSWQNQVSLVVVKLMLSTGEIQGTWIYLPAMCYTKPSRELGRDWPSWPPLILVVNPLCVFEVRCSQDLVEVLKFLNRNLESSMGFFFSLENINVLKQK